YSRYPKKKHFNCIINTSTAFINTLNYLPISSLASTVKNTQKSFLHLYQRHKIVSREKITKLRKAFVTNTRETARKDYFHIASILKELPTPKYVFPERARLIENFYGPKAENYNKDKLRERHI
ncbi:uncharacterized protein N7459_003585, partial [Penicillium hispanicum]|uniref:uncharacterized protein n=1 Tax=Penicillium hispanicum TaxID=1080232 RepID=UPI0025404978